MKTKPAARCGQPVLFSLVFSQTSFQFPLRSMLRGGNLLCGSLFGSLHCGGEGDVEHCIGLDAKL